MLPGPLLCLYRKHFRLSTEGVPVIKTWRELQAVLREEDGMTTAEYAVGTVAACAFAAVLLKVVSGHEVLALLTSIVTRALHTV
jgi:hypothetical protein